MPWVYAAIRQGNSRHCCVASEFQRRLLSSFGIRFRLLTLKVPHVRNIFALQVPVSVVGEDRRDMVSPIIDVCKQVYKRCKEQGKSFEAPSQCLLPLGLRMRITLRARHKLFMCVCLPAVCSGSVCLFASRGACRLNILYRSVKGTRASPHTFSSSAL